MKVDWSYPNPLRDVLILIFGLNFLFLLKIEGKMPYVHSNIFSDFDTVSRIVLILSAAFITGKILKITGDFILSTYVSIYQFFKSKNKKEFLKNKFSYLTGIYIGDTSERIGIIDQQKYLHKHPLLESYVEREIIHQFFLLELLASSFYLMFIVSNKFVWAFIVLTLYTLIYSRRTGNLMAAIRQTATNESKNTLQ